MCLRLQNNILHDVTMSVLCAVLRSGIWGIVFKFFQVHGSTTNRKFELMSLLVNCSKIEETVCPVIITVAVYE